MSKPAAIPADVQRAASECADNICCHDGDKTFRAACELEIARAIMAATLAEREAILQFEFDLPLYASGVDMLIAIREYIRKRGEA